ncbi:hypothetical protein QBC46DRAFT_319554 [Diplogelasinospora grovesii]|uniref:Oxidoreductase acuF-like C2H2 type zinc-finger domain-containing protein n=1 Tax=Diplogelasinospora grovesii TaxID=303347 RepID=A0AAN6S191_9PEZI|nr:hypothetical protein QBC46DRAFT_319554 [Diplogelasinospora grovesii]
MSYFRTEDFLDKAMESVSTESLRCLEAFRELCRLLSDGKAEHRELMPQTAIENEQGRFRVWCGNLGAVQEGYSSLDYRLRESVVMHSNIVKLLKQLLGNIRESIEVISGRRLPFEQQMRPQDMSDDESDSEANTDLELVMRLTNIVGIMKDLYKLSFKIRNPNFKSTPLRLSLYQEIDPESKVDIFEAFAKSDLQHVEELVKLSRTGRDAPDGWVDYLTPRLAAANTLRRKHFKYWERHARKLAGHLPQTSRTKARLGVGTQLGTRGKETTDTQTQMEREAEKSMPKTLLSQTEASRYEATLDDRTERGSVASYASTALDIEGKSVELPRPPSAALQGKEFICPYCLVLCPARHGWGKSWRVHVLHDLQAYLCTYEDCPQPNQLYRSRRHWVSHEDSTHRRYWRCHEHPDVLYQSAVGLRSHYHQAHAHELTEEQMNPFVELSTICVPDARSTCPTCFALGPFPMGITNHLANHLERVSVFALPRSVVEAEHSARGSNPSRRVGHRSVDSGLFLIRIA